MNLPKGLVGAWLLCAACAHAAEERAVDPLPEQDAEAPAAAHCLHHTGSRIPPRDGECLPVSGRVITQDEMRRQGASNAAEALRLLRP